jgi:hypothetical protein
MQRDYGRTRESMLRVPRAREPCRRAWCEVPGHGPGQGRARVQPGHDRGMRPRACGQGVARPPAPRGRGAGCGARSTAEEGLAGGRGGRDRAGPRWGSRREGAHRGARARRGRGHDGEGRREGPRGAGSPGSRGGRARGRGSRRASRVGARPRGRARVQGKKKGRGREREKGRGGENSPRGSKLRRSRVQTLGHHRER